MDALLSGGHLIDAILTLVAIEALWLILWRRHVGALVPLLCNLASGAALMLALRAALTGAHWSAIAACLALAGLAHATELTLRLAAAGTTAPARIRLDPHT